MRNETLDKSEVQHGADGRRDEILISEDALAKLRLVARIMGDEEFRLIAVRRVGIPLHYQGLSVIEDFRIPSGQHAASHKVVTPGSFLLDEYDLLREEGFVAIGLAHGHGPHPVFYSSHDHQAFDEQLDIMGDASAQVHDATIPWFKGESIHQLFTEQYAEKIGEDQVISTALHLPGYAGISLVFPEEDYSEKEVRSFAQHVRLRVKRKRKEIASIVINGQGDLYSIKRYEETIPLMTLESMPCLCDYVKEASSEFPAHALIRGSTMRYSKTASLVPVKTDHALRVDEEELVQELERKVHGTGLPSLHGGRVDRVRRNGVRELEQCGCDSRQEYEETRAVAEMEAVHRGTKGPGEERRVLKDTTSHGLDQLLSHYAAILDTAVLGRGAGQEDKNGSRTIARSRMIGEDFLAVTSSSHALDALLEDASLPEKTRRRFEDVRLQYSLLILEEQGGVRTYAKGMITALNRGDDSLVNYGKAAPAAWEEAGNILLALGERAQGAYAHHEAMAIRLACKDGECDGTV